VQKIPLKSVIPVGDLNPIYCSILSKSFHAEMFNWQFKTSSAKHLKLLSS